MFMSTNQCYFTKNKDMQKNAGQKCFVNTTPINMFVIKFVNNSTENE